MKSTPALRALAEYCGVSTSHSDGLGRRVEASDAAMLAILRALGVNIESPEQAGEILEERRRQPAPLAEPCQAGEEGEVFHLRLSGPDDAKYRVVLTLESGEERHRDGRLGDLPELEGVRLLDLGMLDYGYHVAETTCGDERVTTNLLVAPRERFGAPGDRRSLGLFAPLYALRGECDYGVGDFSDLGRLMRWAGELGLDFVGTLPLSAGNYREEFQTSPYAPVSRLFWNPLYLDVDALAETFSSSHLAELMGHPRVVAERERLAALDLVDYQKSAELKSRLLYRMSDAAWEKIPEVLEAHLVAHPELDTYARFRALQEATGTTYHHWKLEEQLGDLSAASYEDDDYRFHVFVQWAAEQQLSALAESGCGLYLDLSVGAQGSSYDVWRHQQSFVREIDVGAPPDALFEGGQNWALPPLHPERSREGGHRYFVECVRANMRHASILRVDHVMGLNRLYWVTPELGASQGLYVRYPADELYAILRIEALRNQCTLVGEDLGTVPDTVRPAMRHAGMHGLYVGIFSVEGNEDGWPTLLPPDASAFASLNTHDTPTFAGWFAEADLKCNPEHLMKRWTEFLAEGPAAAVIVTLEDLWLEPRPQNQPGTGLDVPNWRRRFSRSQAEVFGGEEPAAWLRHLVNLRSH